MKQLELLKCLYQTVYQQTESLEQGDVGADLAYLMGAILNQSRCEWPEDRPLVQLLRHHFDPRHRIWKFIELEEMENA
jgi:hypothetical protein